MTILLTGFEAFGNTPVNPAERVANRLGGEQIGQHSIASIIVPNTFFDSIDVVTDAIAQFRPEIVVMMGEYGGRNMITVERLAQNLNDSCRYDLADNAGNRLQDELTVGGGPAAYYSTLPIRAMVRAMRNDGIPTDISDTPGTNVCNHLMYGILHHIHTQALAIRAGWIHLPHLPETAALEHNLGAPSMSSTTSEKGVRTALHAIVDHPTDIEESVLSRWQV